MNDFKPGFLTRRCDDCAGFSRQWVPATESIAVALLRDKLSGQTICTATAARRVAPRDGRNEHVPLAGKDKQGRIKRNLL